jgi:hypothetical protein
MVPGEKNDLNSNQVVDYNNTGLKVNMDQLYKTVDFKFQAGADVSRIANMGSCATWEIGGGLDYGFVNTNKKEFNHAVGVNAKAGVDLYLTSKIKAIVTAGVKATCSVDGKPLDADLFSCVKTKNDKIGYTYGGSAALQFANIANLKFSVFAVQGENGKQVPAGQISLILGFNEDCD